MKRADTNGQTYTYRLTVALTLEQAGRLEEAARLAGLKPGVYARHLLTSQPMPEPPRAMIDMEAARALQGSANNLNQLAKLGWRGGWDPPTLGAARQAVLDCAALLRRLLGLAPLSSGELERLHPSPVIVERIEAKPAPASPAAASGKQPSKPSLGY